MAAHELRKPGFRDRCWNAWIIRYWLIVACTACMAALTASHMLSTFVGWAVGMLPLAPLYVFILGGYRVMTRWEHRYCPSHNRPDPWDVPSDLDDVANNELVVDDHRISADVPDVDDDQVAMRAYLGWGRYRPFSTLATGPFFDDPTVVDGAVVVDPARRSWEHPADDWTPDDQVARGNRLTTRHRPGGALPGEAGDVR